MVVAQLVHQLLLTPKIRGSDPVIGSFSVVTLNIIEKTKTKEKEVGNGTIKKKIKEARETEDDELVEE